MAQSSYHGFGVFRHSRLWVPVGGLLLLAALLDVDATGPRIAVRWHDGITQTERRTLEGRYDLRNGAPDSDARSTSTWRYDLGDRSQRNIGALIGDPAVADTGYIDRGALTARGRNVRVRVRPLPRTVRNWIERAPELLRLHPSLWLLTAGVLLLWAAGLPHARDRRNATIAALLFVGVLAVALPFDPSFLNMGESRERTADAGFETYYGGGSASRSTSRKSFCSRCIASSIAASPVPKRR